MTQDQSPTTNVESLLSHLKPDSLAVRLVTAYAGAREGHRDDAMKEVLKDRVIEIERTYDHVKN